jgi:hypothetical protein
MHDWGFVLLVLGVILAVITLVGHGIWVLLATLLGSVRHTTILRRRKCVFCGKETPVSLPRCDWCGRVLNDRLAAELADLDAVRRQLRRFRQSGALKPEKAAKFLARLRKYRQKSLTPSVPEKPFARPVDEAITAATVRQPIPQQAVPATPPAATPVASPTLSATIPAPQPVPAAPQRQPAVPPQQTWAELLAGFLEERNIRWAELIGVLVGGLLIVGSSLALVVSFWDTLQETYLKFLIFVGYSSLVFGVGLFAYHRWKLASTGRGLLTIATLLVPLNFVAMASLSRNAWGWQTAMTELVSLGIFTGLSALAADVLVGGRRWPLVLAVLGNSALILLVTRLLDNGSSDGMLLAANCVPAILLAVAMIGHSVGSPARRLTPTDAGARFTLLGLAAFASVVALGIVAVKSSESLGLRVSLHCLAPALALAAWPLLASGLRIMRGMERGQPLEVYRTSGTIIALLGVVLELAALGLVWPQPLGLVAVGLVNAASLIFVSLRYRFPVAHAGAMLCLALAYLAGFHLLTDAGLRRLQSESLMIHDGGLGLTMLDLMLSARSATSLCGLFLVFAAIAACFVRRGWRRHALAYGLGCGVTAASALLAVTTLATIGNHADALHAATLYAFYGAACFLVSTRWQRVTFSYIGWNLLAAAPFWTLHAPLFVTWQGTAALAGCLFWLAAIWLLLAWLHRNRDLFSAGQCVLTVASGVAITAWLQTQSWVARFPEDLLDPRSLQTYGIALGVLSLSWIAARIVLRGNPAARPLLDPGEPTVDWFVRHLVIWLQTLLALSYVMPGVARELYPRLDTTIAEALHTAGGPAGWILLGVLATVLIAGLWERWRVAELLGALLLAATAPCLLAGQFADEVAVASALRWGLAICFLVCSAFIWQRRRLLDWGRLAKTSVELDARGPQIARTTLLAITAWPVIVLTFIAALLQFASVTPGGPAIGSFFERVGPNVSYMIPLLLVILGLVGHALREISAGYAFSAGLVVDMAVVLGYALSVVMDPDPTRSIAAHEFVTTIQLATIAAAAWAIAWLLARKWVGVWREETLGNDPLSSRRVVDMTPTMLMNLQLGMGYLGNAILLATALVVLAWFHPHRSAWPINAGMPLGWIALATATTAGVYRRIQMGVRPSFDAIGLLGMAAIGLVACVVRGLELPAGSPVDPNWAYRVLMLGWATYALLITLITWWVARKPVPSEVGDWPQSLSRAAVTWVRIAAIAAVLLGLKAAFFHEGIEECLWAAATIAVASTAGAAMAVWQRREGWAFAAALGVNLAASLVAWHFDQTRHLTFDQCWLKLLQANVIASSAVALVWLAGRRWLYEVREWTLGTSPLLALQITLPVAANSILLLAPVLWLLQSPAWLPPWMGELADASGWTALLLCAVAAAWYLWQTLPGNVLHALGGVLLGIGVLVACWMPHFNSPQLAVWLEYHMLTMAWAAAASCMLGIGFAANSRGWGNRCISTTAVSAPGAAAQSPQQHGEFPPSLVSGWVTFIGVLSVVLAIIYSPVDRAGAWWSIRAIGSISVAVAILALWRRSPLHVFFSGLLLNVIGIVAWLAWGNAHEILQLAHLSVLCLATASGVWTVLQLLVPRGVPHLPGERRPLVFAHLAAAVGLTVMTLLAAYGLFCTVQAVPHAAVTRLAWIALAGVAASIALTLWDRAASLSLCGLYLAGLTALAMFWGNLPPSPRELFWQVASELPAFTLVAAMLGWWLRRGRRFWQSLRIATDPDRWSTGWFMCLQAILAAVAAIVVVGVSVDFAFDGFGWHMALFDFTGRMAGCAGALMLLGAMVVMAWQSKPAWRSPWQYAALAAGLLLMSCGGWAALDPTASLVVAQAPWLHRSVILLVAATMMILVSGFELAKSLPKTSDWLIAGRRAAPRFGGLTLAALGVVLAQEACWFDRNRGIPMASWAIAIVAVTLAVLIIACIVLAVSRQMDPLGLGDRGRQAYVYAAEALLVLMGLHLRMSMPWLFRLGIVERYWMLLVMAVAFGGSGLSEFFHRRRLPVLSDPLERTALLLPLLPAVGFWFASDPASAWGILGRAPVLWFLMSAFYGSLAYMRRSAGCVALAALVANIGLWVALHESGIAFLHHPQLWLIPIALAALVAEYLNHERLSATQSTAFRYLALSTIYLSSTADMFIAGLGKDWRLPLALMLLSVAGVLAGLLLRIRSFLWLGIVFLLLDITAIIWHAAVDLEQTWIWYACGIVLGAVIIALFALFEKRRNDLLATMVKLKQWER